VAPLSTSLFLLASWGLAAQLEISVQEAPAARMEDVRRARQHLVVRWSGEAPATVEARHDGRWVVLGREVTHPFTTPRLPAATEVRVVVEGVVSEPASAPGVWSPSDVAGWSGPGLRGARAVQLEEAGDSLWVATLGGGLGKWDGDHWTHLDRRDGLPGHLAIGVDATEEAVWVATNGGLARVEKGRVTRTWGRRDGLPDDYTQAVYADGDAVWAGTYRGLARVRGDMVSIVLAPWSCFSLLRGPDQRVWVGYQGLRGLPDGEPIEGVDPALRVFDAEPRLRGVWLASDEQGLLWLEDGLVTPEFRPEGGEVFGIADLPSGVMVAAGDDGLWHRIEGRWVHFGMDSGLPSPVANTVAPGPREKAWVGTDRGVALLDPTGKATALPLAPLAAGLAVRSAVRGQKGITVATEDDLVWLGRRPPRGWTSLAAATGGAVRGLLALGREWWVVTDAVAFHLDRRGRLTRWNLPNPGVAAAPVPGGVALATTSGLHWWMPGATQLSAALPLPDLRVVHAGSDGGLWAATATEVVRLAPGAERRWHNIPNPTDITSTAAAAWVASAGGLYSIDRMGEVVSVSDHWRAGPLVAVSAWGDAVWAAGADGRLWGPNPTDPRMVDLDQWLPAVEVLGLTAEEDGVWVATDQGLFWIDGR
jgi:ligand-binding sensor domain-containing protein